MNGSALSRSRGIDAGKLLKLTGALFFAYLFFGFMLLPCLNTLTSIFNTKNAAGERDAVVITTQNSQHALAALMAMRRGIHVFVEKPVDYRIERVNLQGGTCR